MDTADGGDDDMKPDKQTEEPGDEDGGRGSLYVPGPAFGEETQDRSGEIGAVDVRQVYVTPEAHRVDTLGNPAEPTGEQNQHNGEEDTPVPEDPVEPDAVSPSTQGALDGVPAGEAALMTPVEVRQELEDFFQKVNSYADDFYWIAHITATATSRMAKHSLWSGARTGARMVRAAASARSFDEFVDRYEEIAVDEMERQGRSIGDGGRKLSSRRTWGETPETADELRQRGEELLEMSADVDFDKSVHPAFNDILDQLAPDEARILRLLAVEGSQPSVNVRDKGWLPVSTDLVAAGLSMVGTEAGLTYESKTQAYLNNLNRLGLVWFSDEAVDEMKRYQLVEAQPDVKAAIGQCKRAKVIRRSIHLTPFGVEFCEVCLPVEVNYENASGVYDAPINRTERGSGR